MRTFALAVGGLWLAATAAHAAPIQKGGLTGPEMVKIMQDKGLRAALDKDSEGDPRIQSAVSGANFRVYFYDCTAGRCTAVQFSTVFDLDKPMALSKINDWNRKRRFGRAYLDDEGDPYVEMDVDVEVGATTEGMANQLDAWEAVMGAFQRFLQE